METIGTASLVEALSALLEEVHVGPPDPRATWITSNRAGSGFLGTLDATSAAVASTPPGPGRNTIAAHAGHLLFALSLAVRAMHGENPYATVKWSESWKMQVVDGAAWATLRAELRRVHGELLEALRDEPPLSNADVFKGVLSLVGHGAYHLGAIQTIHHLVVPRA